MAFLNLQTQNNGEYEYYLYANEQLDTITLDNNSIADQVIQMINHHNELKPGTVLELTSGTIQTALESDLASVVIENNEVVGFVKLVAFEFGSWIVHPHHQGKKIGTALYKSAMEIAGNYEGIPVYAIVTTQIPGIEDYQAPSQKAFEHYGYVMTSPPSIYSDGTSTAIPLGEFDIVYQLK